MKPGGEEVKKFMIEVKQKRGITMMACIINSAHKAFC